MAIDTALLIGGNDDPVEASEFIVKIDGPLGVGEYEFQEVGPLGQFEIPRIMLDYGDRPEKKKRLSSKVTFEPVKFVSYTLIDDPRLRQMVMASRPRRGRAGSPLYQITVSPLDRDGGVKWSIILIDAIIYQVNALGTMNAGSASEAAKFEFMADPNDWRFSDIP